MKPKSSYYTYRGVMIFRNDEPGYKLRYTARVPGLFHVASDTLAGIKAIIKRYLVEAYAEDEVET